ncbi:MAG: dienelactone hydrolase family protein [Planctomycetes bacterium]|nr:dienelactone hydrolase family protein [Planctomycetota bacterium]
MAEKKPTMAQRRGMQPATALWKMYDPANAEFAFKATDARQARAWQRRTRKALIEVIGFHDSPKAAPAPGKLESVDKGDYVRNKILIRTAENTTMPVYMLLPKRTPRPMPVVLALHGHGYGVKDIVGLWEDGNERNKPDGYHKDFAVALCRRGFAVAAPEISCFGERHTDFSYLNTTIGQGPPDTCTHTAMLAFHLGKSVVGLRTRDAMALVDYLETRNDVDTARLGAMGISGGGMHTFFSTCLDERIKACVVSGYYSSFKSSILAMSHCACNFVPGLHRFGEMHDLVGLIAPRPMLVEAATYDPIFPIAAVRRGVARARKVYELFGAEKKLETDYFEGRHQISGARAYDFLWEKLAY